MNKGKLSESALKRSVLKRVSDHNKRSGAGIGIDAGGFEAKGQRFLMSSAAITGEDKGNGELAVVRAVNSMAAAGGRALAVSLSVITTDTAGEAFVKRIVDEAARACEKTGTTLVTGNTLVGGEASVSVTVTGEKENDLKSPGKDRDRILIMAGNAGNAGSAMLADKCFDRLKQRLTADYINKAIGDFNDIGTFEAARRLAEKTGGTVAMHDISEGGVFGALWELLEREKAGASVYLKDIPIRQSAIEVCEILDVSPYQLRGDGGLLAIVEDSPENRELGKVIGIIDNSADRVIINGEEKRFLEPNRFDPYYDIP
ncbi:MAG: hypothetical protein IJS80_07095 [Lachnospiraceae bacterium]|nr:hypothetical protein [Lachnospiraceae bacterium]